MVDNKKYPIIIAGLGISMSFLVGVTIGKGYLDKPKERNEVSKIEISEDREEIKDIKEKENSDNRTNEIDSERITNNKDNESNEELEIKKARELLERVVSKYDEEIFFEYNPDNNYLAESQRAEYFIFDENIISGKEIYTKDCNFLVKRGTNEIFIGAPGISGVADIIAYEDF